MTCHTPGVRVANTPLQTVANCNFRFGRHCCNLQPQSHDGGGAWVSKFSPTLPSKDTYIGSESPYVAVFRKLGLVANCNFLACNRFVGVAGP